jgi:hypothetical protein
LLIRAIRVIRGEKTLKDSAVGGVYRDEYGIQLMKPYLLVLLAASILPSTRMFGQEAAPGESFTDRLRTVIRDSSGNPAPALPRFDLDFPGGTPLELARRIEQASARPVNLVVSEANNTVKLPAVSVKNVTVPQLFQAISAATHKEVWVGNQAVATVYGSFDTKGEVTENSVWSFNYYQPLPPPNVCRFYQLGSLLEAGYKVEDITTAIETGWKMLGEANPPKISYHKDTKLLIAVGEEKKMNLIADVLQNLKPPQPKVPPTPNVEKPKAP